MLFGGGAVNATGRSLQQPTISALMSKYSDRNEQGAVFGLFHGLMSLARVAGPSIAAAGVPATCATRASSSSRASSRC